MVFVVLFVFVISLPPRSARVRSSAASDVYKRQVVVVVVIAVVVVVVVVVDVPGLIDISVATRPY